MNQRYRGIILVLIFFTATRLVERSPAGEVILHGLDRVTGPLWARLDDFVRVVIGAFFVAIFAIGGIYLTPDLKTPAEWVSWTQLLIAALIFSRRTQPLAAAGFRPEPPRTLDGGDLAIKVWTGTRGRLSAKPAPEPASPLPIPSLSL